MKRILITTLVLILSGTLVHLSAGEKGHRQGNQMDPERRARMQEKLGLTDLQMEQMREIRQNGGTREDMRSVLTEEQLGILHEMRANRKARGGKDRGSSGSPPETVDESTEAENEDS